MKVIGWVIAGIVAVVLIAVMSVGVWHLGWFVTKENVNKQSEIYNDSFQRQNALVAEAGRNISDVATIDVQIASTTDEATKAPLAAQRKAIVTQACETIGKLSGTVTVPQSTTAFAAKECI